MHEYKLKKSAGEYISVTVQMQFNSHRNGKQNNHNYRDHDHANLLYAAWLFRDSQGLHNNYGPHLKYEIEWKQEIWQSLYKTTMVFMYSDWILAEAKHLQSQGRQPPRLPDWLGGWKLLAQPKA